MRSDRLIRSVGPGLFQRLLRFAWIAAGLLRPRRLLHMSHSIRVHAAVEDVDDFMERQLALAEGRAPLPRTADGNDDEGWVEHITATGRSYYHNASSGQTTWDRPLTHGPQERSFRKIMKKASSRYGGAPPKKKKERRGGSITDSGAYRPEAPEDSEYKYTFKNFCKHCGICDMDCCEWLACFGIILCVAGALAVIAGIVGPGGVLSTPTDNVDCSAGSYNRTGCTHFRGPTTPGFVVVLAAGGGVMCCPCVCYFAIMPILSFCDRNIGLLTAEQGG